MEQDRQIIDKALTRLDDWFMRHEVVNTAIGTQSTKHGYQLLSIRIMPRFVSIEVYALSRACEENDQVRGKDEAYFVYDLNKDEIKER